MEVEDRLLSETVRAIRLANDIIHLLETHQIDKAKNELHSLVRLETEKIRRIHKELGDQHLLRECYIVLNDAKQILKDYPFSKGSLRNKHGAYIEDEKRILEPIEQLLRNIATIEHHEISDVREDREKIRSIRRSWEQNIEHRVVYHGTSSAGLHKIRRYGLVPGMRVYDLRELTLLLDLMEKAGYRHAAGPWFKPE